MVAMALVIAETAQGTLNGQYCMSLERVYSALLLLDRWCTGLCHHGNVDTGYVVKSVRERAGHKYNFRWVMTTAVHQERRAITYLKNW